MLSLSIGRKIRARSRWMRTRWSRTFYTRARGESHVAGTHSWKPLVTVVHRDWINHLCCWQHGDTWEIYMFARTDMCASRIFYDQELFRKYFPIINCPLFLLETLYPRYFDLFIFKSRFSTDRHRVCMFWPFNTFNITHVINFSKCLTQQAGLNLKSSNII